MPQRNQLENGKGHFILFEHMKQTLFIVLGLALWTEIKYEPPMWLHLVIFLPLALVVCLGLLRPLKGLLVALQYRNKAGQGRVDG